MRIAFRPLRPSDFFEIDVNPRHAWSLPYFRCSLTKVIPALMDDPFSFCMEVDGKPVALLGTTPRGGCWALLSKNMKPYMLRLHRYVTQMNDIIFRTTGQLWAEIDRTDPAAIRWMIAQKFTKKGPTRGNMDLWVYAPV